MALTTNKGQDSSQYQQGFEGKLSENTIKKHPSLIPLRQAVDEAIQAYNKRLSELYKENNITFSPAEFPLGGGYNEYKNH